jgi:uncharacterized membrane protein
MATIVRAAAAGVAAGSRTTLGFALPLLLARRRWLRTLGALAVGGELVGDKLPMTPSRLDPPGPAVRALAGAVAGATVARHAGTRSRFGVVGAAVVGAAASAAGTWGGAAWRRAVAERGRPDLPAALVEDAAAVTLAVTASR